jgi:hypothetical protein
MIMSEAAVASGAPTMDQRRAARRRFCWSGTLQTSEGPFPCTVVDLSLGGAKVALHELPRRSRAVSLVMPQIGAFRGELVWQQDGIVGIGFRDAPESVARLIEDSFRTVFRGA